MPTALPVGTVLLALEKKFGKGTVSQLGAGAKSRVTEVIPTGLSVIDHHVLGIGGLPVGRMSEVFSDEGTGKTSFMLHCLAACQRAGGIAALVETENALDLDWAELHGVNLRDLILLEPDHIEDVTKQIEALLAVLTKSPSLIAWDSLAATATKGEIVDGLAGSDAVADRARLMSKACRVWSPALAKSRAHLMVINQQRDNIGVMFGPKFTTPGGKAIKYHSSLRLQLLGGKKIEGEHGEHTGKDITIVAAKNKLHAPFRKARLRLSYASGFDELWSTLTHAKDRKLAKPRSRGKVAYDEAMRSLGWADGQTSLVDTEPEIPPAPRRRRHGATKKRCNKARS